MKQVLEISSHYNDLFAKFKCLCPDMKYAGTPIAKQMKTTITLTGYNDDYFFDQVNRNPIGIKCECGRRYKIQWKRDGVEVETVK